MNIKTLFSGLALPVAAVMASCGDTTSVGSSIVQDNVVITIDSAFTVTGKTLSIGKVQSRTTSQLIGRIDANGYGRISSDVVTQFMPASQLDTANIRPERIDSLVLILTMAAGEFVGDSVAPMGLDVYPLTKQLPSPIYSDFDPEGYFDGDNLLASAMYNVTTISSGVYNKDGSKSIRIKMPAELGQKLYNDYVADPSAFGTPTSFARIFPGLYIKNSFGSGRLTRITSTVMKMHYHYNYFDGVNYTDSVLHGVGNYFAVTPEIITNNNISMTVAPQIDKMVDEGKNVLVAPVGKEVELRFPAPEIIDSYKKGTSRVRVLNTLSFKLPAYSITNSCNIMPPEYVLLVLKSKKDEFFSKNNLPDNVTSFYAKYNSTTKLYDFGDMRAFIVDLLSKDTIKEEDYTFTLIPVAATFETNNTSSYYYSYATPTLALLAPYVAAPVMCEVDLSGAKIRLTYSSQWTTDKD